MLVLGTTNIDTPWHVLRTSVSNISPGITNVVVFGPRLLQKNVSPTKVSCVAKFLEPTINNNEQSWNINNTVIKNGHYSKQNGDDNKTGNLRCYWVYNLCVPEWAFFPVCLSRGWR